MCVCSLAVWAAFLAPSSAHTYAWTLWHPSAAEATQHSQFYSSHRYSRHFQYQHDQDFCFMSKILFLINYWLPTTGICKEHNQTIRKRTGTEDVLTKSLSLCCFSSTSFIISVILCSLVSISCCCSSLCLNTLSICCQSYIRFPLAWMTCGMLCCEQVWSELINII